MVQFENSTKELGGEANQPLRRGVSIVIPSWNGRHLLEKYLPSVASAAAGYGSSEQTEIIVVDDASTDGTQGWLNAHYPAIYIASNSRNMGFAPTANRGARMARNPLVYLVNNDVALEPGTLPPLAAHFEHPNVFAVAGEVYDYDTGSLRGAGQIGELRRGFLGVHRRYYVPGANKSEAIERPNPPWLTLFASGGSAMFDREKFLALGGFDESFAPFGWEDVELSLRAWKQGLEVHYEPRSRVRHQFSSTITPKFKRRQVRAVYERNRLMAHWLHLDNPTAITGNILFLSAKLIGSPVVGRWELWSATAQALGCARGIQAKRREYKSKQQRTLVEVLRLVAAQAGRPGATPL